MVLALWLTLQVGDGGGAVEIRECLRMGELSLEFDVPGDRRLFSEAVDVSTTGGSSGDETG